MSGFVPEGLHDNSPAIYCWVSGGQRVHSPVGTAEDAASIFDLVENVPRVVFDAVSFQERDKLFLIRTMAMVFQLVADVHYPVFRLGDSNAERPVAFLPLELASFGKLFMDPFGRPSFDQCECDMTSPSGCHSAVPTGLMGFLVSPNPAINRWAIIMKSLRDEKSTRMADHMHSARAIRR